MAVALAAVFPHLSWRLPRRKAPRAKFPPEQIKRGAETFATFCTPCHGERMENPELFDLKKFPPDQRSRFINSVPTARTRCRPGAGTEARDIEALWSYVSPEKRIDVDV